MQYKFSHSLFKTIVRAGLLIGPAALTLLPKEWMNVTLGTAAILFFDWLKAKYSTL